MADEVNESKSVDEGKENTEENIEAEKVVVSEAEVISMQLRQERKQQSQRARNQ